MEIPFYSQYALEVPEEWRNRACGVVALKMALDALGAETPSIVGLIQEGETIGAFKGGYWVHQRLTWLAHNYGIPAYSEEFRSDAVDSETGSHTESMHTKNMHAYGIQKITSVLEAGGLVLVSVPKHFQPNGHHHLILLTGTTPNGFVYYDPAYDTAGEGAGRQVAEEIFTAQWRPLAIFLEKKRV